VKKGERGVRILAPIISKRRQRDDRDKDTPSWPMLAGFRNAYVFDVSQTDGEELPTIREIGGDVGENRERLFALVEQQGIELSFSESIAPALGMSYGGRIDSCPVSQRPKNSAHSSMSWHIYVEVTFMFCRGSQHASLLGVVVLNTT
jgi:hypothetical protein